ncbi:hypothetical protein E2C01_042933 [Portunus trituberculatus]|uniref:Uncharacterized protein n=1 Tax=Portunus trituberculatus TaxID=210409 RepID=A0A5B7FUY7_PORTR|nr:hypothetical protein [Portunus trituberculatus]
MAPKRLISCENKESSECSVCEPQPSTSGFTGIIPGESYEDIFVDANSTTDDLPPPPHSSALLF